MVTFQNKEEYMAAIGLDLIGQCLEFKVETRLDDPNYVFKMKILDLVYSVQVNPKDTDTEQGIKNAWEHLIKQFFINQSNGYKMIQDISAYKGKSEDSKLKLINS